MHHKNPHGSVMGMGGAHGSHTLTFGAQGPRASTHVVWAHLTPPSPLSWTRGYIFTWWHPSYLSMIFFLRRKRPHNSPSPWRAIGGQILASREGGGLHHRIRQFLLQHCHHALPKHVWVIRCRHTGWMGIGWGLLCNIYLIDGEWSLVSWLFNNWCSYVFVVHKAYY